MEIEASARHALTLLESTDLVIDGVDAPCSCSQPRWTSGGMGDEAATVRLDSIAKLRAKGNLAEVARLEP